MQKFSSFGRKKKKQTKIRHRMVMLEGLQLFKVGVSTDCDSFNMFCSYHFHHVSSYFEGGEGEGVVTVKPKGILVSPSLAAFCHILVLDLKSDENTKPLTICLK